MENSNSNEPVIINVSDDYGYTGIPCIRGDIGDNTGYEAYIAIISGKLLADIYIEHGSRVLEGNVRAFLGTGGSKSVNGGIKKTINYEPEKIFTYNNGIAVTASDVETELIDETLYITKIVDLQIINGGQTTASLAEAVLKKTNRELAGIYVPMKLTVIDDRETEDENGIRLYDSMVQKIAKFANSQNKVTAADLFSNEPFHVQMEKMSKKYLAPPGKSAVPTGWYYERARKKYQQEQVKLKNDEKKRFVSKFPKNQVITKEQLAMYVTAVFWCRPDIVSRGKTWTMKYFVERLKDEDKNSFNEFWFRKCVCATIIYRTVDNYLESNKDSAKKPTGFWYKTGGYKLNIVPYTVARIISSVPEGLSWDWQRIWEKQAVSSAFMREIEIVTKMTNDFICDSGGTIVTEFCKKELTWKQFCDKIEYSPSDEFLNELMSLSEINNNESNARAEKKEDNNIRTVMDVICRGTDYWQNLVTVAQTNRINISYQELSAINKLIDMTSTGNIPSNPKTGKVPSGVIKVIQTALQFGQIENRRVIE
ncbi:MAG: AIPR family protein [Ruminococcus sp.]|nr:AIPR family protein [Ruminococcus sp.]